MPGFLAPTRSGAHRQAAIALYRALLAQCRAQPIAAQSRNDLQNIVRNRFKQARLSQSIRRLRISFEAGYEALDHLDAGVAGENGSTEFIASLLDRVPNKLKLPPPVKQPLGKALEDVGAENIVKEKPSLFDRPLPKAQLTGKRRVPVLFNANRIPVLRIKKPQPESLSRFLRQRIRQRQSRHDRRSQLLEDEAIAAHEDEWDALVDMPASTDLARAMSRKREPSWAEAVTDARKEVETYIESEKVKNRVMAERMQAVVDREKALFEEEKAEMRMKRRESWGRNAQANPDLPLSK